MERIVKAEVHRLVVVDDDNKVFHNKISQNLSYRSSLLYDALVLVRRQRQLFEIFTCPTPKTNDAVEVLRKYDNVHGTATIALHNVLNI